MAFSDFDAAAMRRALDLARRGEGRVEPNPMVGAVVVDTASRGIVGEGWHARFGGAHAEVAALATAGAAARGASLYVTLEPCCHHGKTPPCTTAILAAGISRVVAATADPFPAVQGRGLAALRAAGVVVETGLLEAEALRLTAPFRKLVATGMPWVIAKWAMTGDRRLAAPPGAGRWISSPESRALVHGLRGRVDAIVVGIGTVLADDPLLTPRPAADRRPLRIVLDGRARLPLESRLVRSASESPVLVAAGPGAPPERIAALVAAGCEVWRSAAEARGDRFAELLRTLGDRRITNVLVEGGAAVFDALFSAGLADELWEFTAPREVGAAADGLPLMPEPPAWLIEAVDHPGGDTFTRGLVRRDRPRVSGPSAGRGSRSASG